MKKTVKLISLLMAMILTVTALSGCSLFGGAAEDPETVKLSVKMGLPVDEKDPEYADWKEQLDYVAKDILDFNNVELTYVKVPDKEGAELDAFMDDVASGEIACFMTEHRAFIDELIEDEALASIKQMQGAFDTIMGEVTDVAYNLSTAIDLDNYMIPLYCTYQGLYYNRGLFKDLDLPNPDSWENLEIIIEALKEKGITPIAAGFADVGLEYMIDEMVLAEGGTAEHSYMPVHGIMSSWDRAIKDIRALESKGAFTADCYNVTFETALNSFVDGSAAMIVAPSTVFNGKIEYENVKATAFPTPITGKREEGAFVGECPFGIYVSKAYFEQTNARYGASVADLCNASSDYFGGETFYNILKGESTMNLMPSYYEFLDAHDPDNPDSMTILEESKKSMIGKAVAADVPMRNRAIDMDAIVAGFRSALTCKESEVDAILLKFSQAETALQEAAEAAREEEEE
ncbi:MAG: extracellular solute-binding protein [Clostridia bacterium]|nr:extracellular solute-binding protein [Clostridia bacterium]